LEGNKYEKKFEDLRNKAEEVLEDKKGSRTKIALEIDELIHELEVHQIELEMQNEELISTQIELEDSRRDYLELYDFSPVGYFTLDENGIIKIVNLTGSDILGKPRKFLHNTAFILYVAPDYRNILHNHFHQVMKTQLKKQCNIELISSDKTPFFVSLDTMPVIDEDGIFKEFRIIVTDSSERKKAEKIINEVNNKLQATIDAIPDLMFEVDDEGMIFSYNAPNNSLLYSPPENFIGKTVFEVLPIKTAAKIMEALKDASENGKHRGMTYHLTFPDGKKYFELSIAKKTTPNSEPHYIALARDITERKEANQQIEKDLKEKEILIKEIHHRVKNNLIVMSSLLNLQADYVKDKESYEMFMESKNRAKSMALIHERLYQSTDLREIDFGEYIRSLSMDLYRTYVSNPELIKLNMELEPVNVDINTAIPVGLMINELVTNAFKYAFPQNMGGKVNIRFHSKDENLILEVSDDGIGFPKDIDFKSTESLGLKLVNVLTSQIDGEIKMKVNNGTHFKIIFPEVKFKGDLDS
jgi:PAS domain S-box-containing protein